MGALVAAACVLAVATNTAANPGDDSVVAAVYAPWRDPADVFTHAAAAAPVLGQGAVPFILLLRPRSSAERKALGHSGAWLILDGSLALVRIGFRRQRCRLIPSTPSAGWAAQS